MRKITAIICFTTFIALQYGKVISYWHCRISAAVNAAQCDCNVLLLDTHNAGTQNATAAAIAKEKATESYLFYAITQFIPPFFDTDTIHFPVYTGLIPDDHTPPVFQPPRV